MNDLFRLPTSPPERNGRFVRARVVLLMTGLALLTGLGATTFRQDYESFLQQLRVRISQTQSSDDYRQLMNWKDTRITHLLQLAPPPAERDAAEWYAMGHLMQLRGALPEAIRHMQESLRRDPANPTVVKGLLGCFLQADQPRAAGRLWQEHRGKFPPAESGTMGLAVAQSFFDRADYLAAVDYLELVRPLFPEAHLGHRLTVMICQNFVLAGEKEKALAYLTARELDSSADPEGLPQLRRQIQLVNTTAPPLVVEHWLADSGSLPRPGAGRVILVDFWAPSCSDCLESMAEISRLYEAYEDAGVDMVSLTILPDTSSVVQGGPGSPEPVEFLSRIHALRQTRGWSWRFGVAASGINHERFAVTTIPHLVLMDKHGRIRYADYGKRLDFSRLQAVIDHLLAED